MYGNYFKLYDMSICVVTCQPSYFVSGLYQNQLLKTIGTVTLVSTVPET
jgi:hypothetical protein